MPKQLIDSRLTLKSYLNIDIKDSNFDDVDDAVVVMDVTFSVDVDDAGLYYDIYEVKNIGYSYTGIILSDDEDETTPIDLLIDESWIKEINKSKHDFEYTKIVLDEVEIDVQNKKIIINFIY